MNSTISLPSSGYNFVNAVKQPITYTFAITMSVIVITSILNVFVLCRRALRLSSCTYYFLASVPTVLVFVIVTPLNLIIQNRYGINFSDTPITCRLVGFISYTSSLLYGLMLICASIDRFCSSSTSVRLRRFTQVRAARKVIVTVWMLTLIYMSPFLAIYHYDASSSSMKCTLYLTTLTTIYLMSRVVFHYFLIPIILGIFGVLTIYNIRSQGRRIRPVNVGHFYRRTEGQLARMLIIQVAVYLLFFTPCGIVFIILTFVPSINTPYFNTIRTLTVVWLQGGYFISFFLYALSGKIYREELKKMFKWNRIRE